MKSLFEVTGGMIIREGTFIWQKIVLTLIAKQRAGKWSQKWNKVFGMYSIRTRTQVLHMGSLRTEIRMEKEGMESF